MIPRWIQNVYLLYLSGVDIKHMIAFESDDTEAFVLPYKDDLRYKTGIDNRYVRLQTFINRKAIE